MKTRHDNFGAKIIWAGLCVLGMMPLYFPLEAQAQAICMQTKDYERAYEAFVAKTKPVFKGN